MLVLVASNDVASSWDQLVMLNRRFLVAKGDWIQSCVGVVGDVVSLVESLDSFKGVGLGSMDGFATDVTVGISAMVGADILVVLLLGCAFDWDVVIVVVCCSICLFRSASCSCNFASFTLNSALRISSSIVAMLGLSLDCSV